MLFWELFLAALNSILLNKVRSFLTMLGIIIGVGSVISMISIGQGAKKQIYENIQKMGTKLLYIHPAFGSRNAVRNVQRENLKLDDVEAIRRNIVGVEYVAPEVMQNAQVKYFNKNTNTSIVGITPEYLTVTNLKIKDGRFIDDKDVKQFKRVCVLGKSVQDELFGELSPIGNIIKIKGVSFEIIGVLEEKGQTGFRNPDDRILIPITTFQKRLFGIEALSGINIRVLDENMMKLVETEIENLLRLRHRIKNGEESDFRIRNQTELLEQMNEISKTLTYLLGGIAAVSLIVGGIGIMNIMLVSVIERTREIGIRKAIGAKKRDILLQFLLEAIVVSVSGGFIGIIVGILVSKMIPMLGGFPTSVTIEAIIFSFLFSLAVGLFFGIYPANKASSLNPVEALRYE
ncbi:MAG TPA: ABC transporter permease [bacterium]|nr:ABC transporter permease [bacterium]HOL47158.1 ABC transporter permease [bacterium]HPQ18081.1 ABC transporter permease [bacterium]